MLGYLLIPSAALPNYIKLFPTSFCHIPWLLLPGSYVMVIFSVKLSAFELCVLSCGQQRRSLRVSISQRTVLLLYSSRIKPLS
jgi:hypothetical protein